MLTPSSSQATTTSRDASMSNLIDVCSSRLRVHVDDSSAPPDWDKPIQKLRVARDEAIGDARRAYALGDFSTAKALFEMLLPTYRVSKQLADIHVMLGMIAEEEGDIPSAITCYRAALDAAPQDKERSFIYGSKVAELYVTLKQYKKAIPFFSKALSVARAKKWEAHFDAASVLRRRASIAILGGERKRAVKDLKELSKLIPGDVSVWIQLSTICSPRRAIHLLSVGFASALRDRSSSDARVVTLLWRLCEMHCSNGSYSQVLMDIATCERAGIVATELSILKGICTLARGGVDGGDAGTETLPLFESTPSSPDLARLRRTNRWLFLLSQASWICWTRGMYEKCLALTTLMIARLRETTSTTAASRFNMSDAIAQRDACQKMLGRREISVAKPLTGPVGRKVASRKRSRKCRARPVPTVRTVRTKRTKRTVRTSGKRPRIKEQTDVTDQANDILNRLPDLCRSNTEIEFFTYVSTCVYALVSENRPERALTVLKYVLKRVRFKNHSYRLAMLVALANLAIDGRYTDVAIETTRRLFACLKDNGEDDELVVSFYCRVIAVCFPCDTDKLTAFLNFIKHVLAEKMSGDADVSSTWHMMRGRYLSLLSMKLSEYARAYETNAGSREALGLCLAMLRVLSQRNVEVARLTRKVVAVAVGAYARDRRDASGEDVELETEIAYNLGRLAQSFNWKSLATHHYRRAIHLGGALKREASFNISLLRRERDAEGPDEGAAALASHYSCT